MSISAFHAPLKSDEWNVPGEPACEAAPPPRPEGRRSSLPATELTSSSRRRHYSARILPFLVGGDLVGVTLAGVLTAVLVPWIGQALPPVPHGTFLLVSCTVVAAVLVAGVRTRSDRLIPRVADDLGGVVARLSVAGLVLLAGSAISELETILPAPDVAILLATTAVVVPVARRVALALAAAGHAHRVRVVVVGSGHVCDDLCQRLRRSPVVTLAGVLGGDGAAGDRLVGNVDDLPELCTTLRIDRVVIAFGKTPPAHVVAVLHQLRGVVDIDVVVRYYELANWESRLDDVTGLSIMHIGPTPGPTADGIKRLLDICVAAGLLVVLSPLLGLLALAVLVDSGKPVLFRQKRIGRDHQPFEILKFRTMRADTMRADLMPAEPMRSRTPLVVPDASRITRLGRILRRSGVDELAQLVNVLRGEMSLVGPRPFVPQECVDLPERAEPRFSVRPGVTGLWQVCGQHTISFEELCRLDVQYATSWSLGGDFRILARTPSRLVRGSRG
jgi:lipopolysaccharide/colanic/teichoic acid biosynthesis glycosyltransferase